MTPMFSHAIELADLADMKDVDDIKVNGNNNETYALKYNNGLFELVSESEEGAQKLINLKDVSAPTYTPDGPTKHEYKALFKYNIQTKHFVIEPLVKFLKIPNNDANDFLEEMALGNMSASTKSIPPCIKPEGMIMSFIPGIQMIYGPHDLWYRRKDKTKWDRWVALNRPKAILDLKITPDKVVSSRKGFVRKIYNSGEDFCWWRPVVPKEIKLDTIKETLSHSGVTDLRDLIGVTGGKIKLNKPFPDDYYSKLYKGVINIQGWVHVNDNFSDLMGTIKIKSTTKSFVNLSLRLERGVPYQLDDSIIADTTVVKIEAGRVQVEELDLSHFTLVSFSYHSD